MRDFLAEMLYALTSAYSRKDYDNRQSNLPLETKIGKLFAVFAWGLNSVQEQAELIKLWDNIDTAKGSVLDRYGANFGVYRSGADDMFYRLLIKVKMLSQLSGGDIDTLIRAAAQLFDIQDSQVELTELFPAKIRVYVNEADLTPQKMEEAPLISRLMKRLTAAGVGFKVFLRSYRTLRYTISITTASFILTWSEAVPPEVYFYAKNQLGIKQGAFLVSEQSAEPFPAKVQAQTQAANGLGSFYQSRITLRPVQEE